MAVALREAVERYTTTLPRRLGRQEIGQLRAHLEQRLLRGQDHVEAARAEGRELAALEQRWVDLLRAYERLCDLEARCWGPDQPR